MTEPDEPRLGPPPVDELSDVAWARVERGVLARLDSTGPAPAIARRRISPWLALPIAAAAAAAVAIAVVATREPAAPVAAIVDEPSRVVAGAAPSAVSFGDAHITLDANSSLVMDRDDGKPTALLERGAAWFSVAPRGSRPPFVVRAGDAIVRVIGTRFRVARDGERAEVAVDHGVVEVRFRGSVVQIAAGQSWTSEKPNEVAAVAPPSEPEIEMAPDPIPHHADAPRAEPKPDADHARYDALAKLEATRPEVAMKGYLELSQGSGPWAEVALYAAARLAVDRHDARASALLTIYLRRFPRGANVGDARELLARFKGESP